MLLVLVSDLVPHSGWDHRSKMERVCTSDQSTLQPEALTRERFLFQETRMHYSCNFLHFINLDRTLLISRSISHQKSSSRDTRFTSHLARGRDLVLATSQQLHSEKLNPRLDRHAL